MSLHRITSSGSLVLALLMATTLGCAGGNAGLQRTALATPVGGQASAGPGAQEPPVGQAAESRLPRAFRRAPVGSLATPVYGSRLGARVTVEVFTDFQCPFCSTNHRALLTVARRHPQQVAIVHRDLPLGFHRQARSAALHARCAGAQGRFWPYAELLFQNSFRLDGQRFLALAARLRLDEAALARCVADPRTAQAIATDERDAQRRGVRGTPTAFLNGRRVDGARSLVWWEQEVTNALRRP